MIVAFDAKYAVASVGSNNIIIHLNILTCIGYMYKVHAVQSRCTVFIH